MKFSNFGQNLGKAVLTAADLNKPAPNGTGLRGEIGRAHV